MEPAVSAATIVTVLVVLVLPACLAGGWWLGGCAELAHVTMAGETITIVPRGVLRWLSFRRQLVLDLAQVTAASVVEGAGVAAGGLRSPGLAVPGLRAGTYRCPEATSYWLVGRAPRLVRLDLSGGSLNYVLLQVRDPDGLVARLGAPAALHPA